MIRLVDQVSGKGESFRIRLRELFAKPQLERVRIAVAYARWDGLGQISDQIESLLRAKGTFEAIYGAGNGVTTPDALYYGLLLNKQHLSRAYTGFIEDEFANASFHPKWYQFQYKDKSVVIVGSNNLTGGGLCRNDELSVEFSLMRESAEEKEWERYWKTIRAKSKRVTALAIRKLAEQPGQSREGSDEVGGSKKGKPFLKQTKPAPKPLFDKILKQPNLSKKAKEELLGGMTELSAKPKRLYLQIFERETGGDKGKPGSAVQFPVATLGAFFGIGSTEQREVTIEFPTQTLISRFMHLSNNTHRLRLAPILAVKRPAVLVLERLGNDRYKAWFANNYQNTLKAKCSEQRDQRSRKWGLE